MRVKQIAGIGGVVLLLSGVVGFSVMRAEGDSTKVLVGKVTQGEITATVSGTGQIRPKTFANIGAEAIGRVTHLYVREGEHVHRGELLATVENVQAAAAVSAQRATIASSQTDITADIASENSARAQIEHAQADLEQKRLDWQRYQQLYREQLVSKQDYDARKAAYDLDVASLAEAQASLAQGQAQTDSARDRLATARATLRSDQDVLNRTVSLAPFDGVVTNLPVREGETVVVGIQNAEGSTLMTIANMSVITAEIKVDETDIVNVRVGQPAQVSVDALPDKVFHGHITEVGDQALLRSTGQATSQSTGGTEEAKDFKVVVTLDPGQNVDALRPGLSATAKIITAEDKNVLSVPIQALTGPPTASALKSGTLPAAPAGAQGVFLVQRDAGKLRAHWVALHEGITGATRMEVSGPIQAGDQIVTGTYQVLRVLKDDARVKSATEAELAPKTDSGS